MNQIKNVLKNVHCTCRREDPPHSLRCTNNVRDGELMTYRSSTKVVPFHHKQAMKTLSRKPRYGRNSETNPGWTPDWTPTALPGVRPPNFKMLSKLELYQFYNYESNSFTGYNEDGSPTGHDFDRSHVLLAARNNLLCQELGLLCVS